MQGDLCRPCCKLSPTLSDNTHSSVYTTHCPHYTECSSSAFSTTHTHIHRHSICTCVHCTCRLWWLLWLCCSGPSVGIMCGGRHAIQCLLRQYHQGGGKLLPVLSSLLSSLSPPSSLPYSLCYIHTYIHFKVLIVMEFSCSLSLFPPVGVGHH